ncbi:M3 family oligoendopeptidase [Clostridium estertheticum]|uniref:M3 family oligoendopeptidase n=1 Tax=Clostridium estertheticum TaxID=238834 RepID=UPI001C7D30A2|nr:M3 family oligoendopeptidase [Clostridium estertheticum]MBX4259254.1 M3 family oligoendopeptidase [Clostridium estertheticum]WLC69476.1 M3 family oligoendopeptidase [Clostridium estertheticum]
MDMKWSLNELYTSFESKEFKDDMISFENSIEYIKEWTLENCKTSNNPKEKIEYYIDFENKFNDLVNRLYNYAELSTSVDTKNEVANKISEKIAFKLSELAKPSTIFSKWLKSLEDLNSIIENSPLLKSHSYYLKNLAKNAKFLLSDTEEELMAKMKNSGSDAWSKLQNVLSSNLLVDITINGEDKKLPLSMVRNMAYDKDKNIRKNAYESELKSYDKIAESSASALNSIKGEVITLSYARGYESVLQNTLEDSRMDKETLDVMLSVMMESLPSFQKYFKKKAELLGHSSGLPFYELFAPVGNVNMHFTLDEARVFIVKNFRAFSDKLANYADNAFEHNWIDSAPKEGKVGGAFCENLHSIKESRILSNFTGSFNDVSTLAHELGHGYHGLCLSKESALNSDYPMPIAETASIFCETLISNAALTTATSEESFVILENDISSSAQVVVDILSRYLFETELFKRRANGSLSVNELNEIMLKAQKDAYGSGLDENFLHPYMWICKPHYYDAFSNFYNFPYAFGLLFSKGLYAKYLKSGDSFIRDYDALLSATGKNSLVDVAKTMNVDLHSIEFWRSSLKLIELDIEKFVNMK